MDEEESSCVCHLSTLEPQIEYVCGIYFSLLSNKRFAKEMYLNTNSILRHWNDIVKTKKRQFRFEIGIVFSA
jgi:hypothetical protein